MTAPILTLMSHMWPEYDYSANVIIAAVMDVTCFDCGVRCPNACSALYGQACRIGVAHGFDHCQTFILDTETGVSLRAAGWHPVAVTRAQKRDRPSRRRKDGLVQIKVRWECRHSSAPELTA